MQLQMFDPAATPVATVDMLTDAHLRGAIETVRKVNRSSATGWPYVEKVCEIEGGPVWAVADGTARFVLVRGLIFAEDDLPILETKIRNAAMDVFYRLDQFKN